MRFLKVLPLVGLAGLTACAATPPLTVAAESCRIEQHQALVGMNIGDVYLPRQLPRREIGPGQIVGFDHQPRRLNIFLDPKGWITRVTCG